MTWTAPKIERSPTRGVADERSALESWLEFQRETLLTKCTGLTGEQLRQRSCPPSPMSLHGLVRHMAEVERNWFHRQIPGADLPYLYITDPDSDADFDGVDIADIQADLATLAGEVERARAVVAGRNLDDTFVHRRTGHEFDIRWVLIHMIEEYARHNGHADLIRERIDGATGV